MELDPNVCYRALRTRDARFDGRFVTAVRSTGVYCRPICPAPTPKRQNCLFLPCAAAAQEAGFRPCLRCRPEASPGTPAWLGTSATVSRALQLISAGALDGGGVEQLAARLGIGERHLRRLFLAHLGASPLAVAHTRRVLFAKKLIDETRLPMVAVALSSGFSSVRRFNDAIRRTYGVSPRALRRASPASGNGESAGDLTLKLPFRPPYPWEAVRRFLAARAIPRVESTDAETYRRTISVGDAQGVVEVRPADGADHLVAHIRLSAAGPLIQVAERLRRIFDLGADPQAISQRLTRDPRLRAVVKAVPGLRVPGAWDGFELAVRAILGQQVRVARASALAGRLVEAHGETLGLEAGPELSRVFPHPDTLAGADLTRLGLPHARARAISSLAEAVAKGGLRLDARAGVDATLDGLRALPGIGEWTVQYIAMRALCEPDAFPASDLGLRRALSNGSTLLPPARVEEVADAWRPWRAYAAMYLWTSDAPPSARP